MRILPSILNGLGNFSGKRVFLATGQEIKETTRIVTDFITGIGGKTQSCKDEKFLIIFGRVNSGSPKALIIYGMCDVQPVNEHKWNSPPFGAEIRDLLNLGPGVIANCLHH